MRKIWHAMVLRVDFRTEQRATSSQRARKEENHSLDPQNKKSLLVPLRAGKPPWDGDDKVSY